MTAYTSVGVLVCGIVEVFGYCTMECLSVTFDSVIDTIYYPLLYLSLPFSCFYLSLSFSIVR